MQQHMGRGSREPSAVRSPGDHLCLETTFVNTFETLLLTRPGTDYVLKKSYHQACLANSSVCMIAAASALMPC